MKAYFPYQPNIKIVLAVIIFLLITVSQNTLALPISPQPLRKLVMESEYIVYADVIDIITEKSTTHKDISFAVLVIKDKLQGTINNDTIKVYFSTDIICPEPAKYSKGETVLAFLNRNYTGYYTHARSYGSKPMGSSAFLVYKLRIHEMQSIMELENEEEKKKQTIDWLVKCALNPVTRFEGILELNSIRDTQPYPNRFKQTQERKYELDYTQKEKLREAFFSICELTRIDMPLINLIEGPNDTEIIDFLIERIIEKDIENAWQELFIYDEIAKLTERDDLKEIVEQINSLYYSDEYTEEKARKLLKEFKEKL